MTSRQDRGGCPFSSASSEADGSRGGLQAGRRDLLLALAGGAVGLGLGSQARATPAETLAPGDDGAPDLEPFYGLHQSGVITPRPAAALIASFDVLAEDRAALERLFRTLTERIAFLMKGGEPPSLDPKYPAPDNGLLGSTVFPDNLTVTVALGTSLFNDRYGLQKLKPTRLIAMEQFPNDALEAHDCSRRRRLAVLLEHRRNEHPRFARHPQAYAGPARAALEDRRLSSRTRSRSLARKPSAICSDSRTAPPISTPATRS